MRKPISLSRNLQKRKNLWVGLSIFFLIVVVFGYLLLRQYARTGIHFLRLRQYWVDPEKYSDWGIRAGDRCGDAPFLMPTDGFVALFWGDRYSAGKKHQGVDIFSPKGSEGIGLTPVVAAFDGYLTRLSEWRSAVIIRIPDDPLHSGRQIWTYYSHFLKQIWDFNTESVFPTREHAKSTCPVASASKKCMGQSS